MTGEEAIEILKDWDGYFIGHSSDDVYEALEMAINALEQEPILDKIREEIKRVYTVCHASNNHDELIRRNVVLQIIDKYKAEK